MSHETLSVIRTAADASRVEVWSCTDLSLFSDAHVSFESFARKLSFHAELRAAVGRMRCSPGQMLDAYYYCRKRDNADTRDVLFDSIDVSSFGAASAHAIRFTRVSRDAPMAPDREPRSVYLRYDVASVEAPSQFWRLQRTPLARWEGVPLILPASMWTPNSKTRKGLYWLSMKKAQPRLGEDQYDGFYALDLILHGPGSLNLTNVIRPLVDGIVASFQYDLGEIGDAELSTLRRELGALSPDDHTLRAWLSDPGRAVLGARDNLALWWGAGDPRASDCVLCRLRLEWADRWYLSGVVGRAVLIRSR